MGLYTRYEGQVVLMLCSLELPELTEDDMPIIEL